MDHQDMDPAELLVQNYLSRLSAAARGRMPAGDRRALVRRTLDFIEQSTGPVGSASALEVGQLLSGLGDPAAIAAQEQVRLAAARGEAAPVPADGARRGRILHRWPGQASWHWPSQPAGRPQLAQSLMDVPAERAGSPADGEELIGKVTTAARPARLHLHRTRTASARTPEVLRLVVTNQSAPSAAVPARPSWPSVVARDADQEDDQHVAAGPPLVVRRAGSLAVQAAGRFRRQPLESVAVVLAGIGGAAFPPVWLLGAVLALMSRVWDYRDKWAGLGLPVLLTVIGTVVGVCLTASHATFGGDVHDGFVSADVLSRVMAVLGASYLAWRATPERRQPVVPSWSKERKLS
jgi:hypothetical protein